MERSCSTMWQRVFLALVLSIPKALRRECTRFPFEKPPEKMSLLCIQQFLVVRVNHSCKLPVAKLQCCIVKIYWSIVMKKYERRMYYYQHVENWNLNFGGDITPEFNGEFRVLIVCYWNVLSDWRRRAANQLGPWKGLSNFGKEVICIQCVYWKWGPPRQWKPIKRQHWNNRFQHFQIQPSNVLYKTMKSQLVHWPVIATLTNDGNWKREMSFQT